MKIAQVTPLYEAVPPKLYGGTERVVAHLTDALVDLGHDVTLFASADAETKARLVPVRDQAIRLDPDFRGGDYAEGNLAAWKALEEALEVELGRERGAGAVQRIARLQQRHPTQAERIALLDAEGDDVEVVVIGAKRGIRQAAAGQLQNAEGHQQQE